METKNSTDEIEDDFRLSCAEALTCYLAGEPLQSLDRQCGKPAHCKRMVQKGEYMNLFKGSQPYHLKIYFKTFRRSLSKS